MGLLIVNIFSIIAQSIASAYIMLLLHNKITNLKPDRKHFFKILFLLIIETILSSLLKNYLPGINTLISLILEVLIIYLVLKPRLITSVLIVIGNMCIFAITEIIGVYSTMFVFKVSMEDLVQSTPKLLCTSVLQILLICGIIFAYLKVSKKKPIDFGFFKNITNKQLILFITLLVIYIFPQMLLFITKSYEYPISLLVINSMQFVLMFVIAFMLVKNIVTSEKTKTDLFISEVHNKTLVGLVDGVRTMKHDFNNIMQSLNGYCLTRQYDKLESHIRVLLKECATVNNLDMVNPSVFNDPAVYGVIGSKFLLSQEKNINFEFDVVTDISKINFPKAYLSRILGILLDNAIEASQKSKETYVRLEMHFDNRKMADVIRILNTYDTSVNIDLTEIFKKGFSTKEVKSGIGLWEVKKLVNASKNSQIFASIEGKYFVQTLIIEHSDDNYEDKVF